MNASLIWKKLLLEGKNISTSEEIRLLAGEIGRDGWRSVKYLQSQGYITRILKGIFYIRSFEERERDGYDHSFYEIVVMALKEKGVKHWYFGLETALMMNNMTHEYFNVDYVLTDSFRTTKVITTMNVRFKFIKRSKKHFKDGIIKKQTIRYSDPEKTVLDLAYYHYLKKTETEYYLSPVREYQDGIDIAIVRKYLDEYPRMFRNGVEGVL